jgi:hypothetical protein
VQQRLRGRGDPGHRGAQLVGRVGEEPAGALLRVPGARLGPFQRVEHLVQRLGGLPDLAVRPLGPQPFAPLARADPAGDPATSPSGRSDQRTMTVTRPALTTSAITEPTMSTRRSRVRASPTRVVSAATVRVAPSARPGPVSRVVTVAADEPVVTVVPYTWPFRVSRLATTPGVLTRLTICCGPTPARASWRPSCTRPARVAWTARSVWPTKTACTAIPSATSTTASTAITASVTRARSVVTR